MALCGGLEGTLVSWHWSWSGVGSPADPPVACVGTGIEPEAVWCSLIEYRPQSVPCGQARMGKEGRVVALLLHVQSWKLRPPHLRGFHACPCPRGLQKRKGSGQQDHATPM